MIVDCPKVKRDGKVAVLISPGYGAGWYSWNTKYPQCLFDPDIVALVEADKRDLITDEYCQKKYNCNYFYAGGARDLQIVWIEEGMAFQIKEYDGFESINYCSNDDWICA